MKHYFKKMSVLLYVCLALFVYSCSEENDFINEQNHVGKTTMQIISFEEFSKNKVALAKLEQVKKKETLAGRIVYDSINNFFINTDYGVYLEKGDKSSYTFPVYRDVNVGKLENLVINKKADGEYESLFVIYDVSDAEKNMIENGTYVNLIDKTTFISLDQNRISQAYCTFVEFGLIEHVCSCGGHTWAQAMAGECPIYNGTSPGTPPSPPTLGIVIFNGICPGAGGSSNNFFDNYSTYTGNNQTNPQPNTTHGTGSNTAITTLLFCGHNCITEDVAVNDPCQELKNLFKKDTIINPNTPQADTLKFPNLKPKIDTLRNFVNSGHEYGYELEYRGALKKYDANFLEGGSHGNFAINIPIGNYGYGGIHSHPKETYCIPSFGDLVWIRDCYKDETIKEYNKSKIVSIIVVRNPNGGTPLTYALKIDNITTFNQNIDDRLSTISEGSIGDKILKIQEQNGLAYEHSTNLERTFLEMFQNCGFSLYKANVALTTWDKLELIPGTADGVVNPIPCNN